MAWLKALHISALLIWCAGLLYLPGLLLVHRQATIDTDFIAVRRAVRFAHTTIVAPAGVMAIASGTALLFITDALHGWMFVKLAFVGVLVTTQLWYGGVSTELSDRGKHPPQLRLFGSLAALVAAIGSILWLVLGEPSFDLVALAPNLFQPGALQSLLSRLIPI